MASSSCHGVEKEDTTRLGFKSERALQQLLAHSHVTHFSDATLDSIRYNAASDIIPPGPRQMILSKRLHSDVWSDS